MSVCNNRFGVPSMETSARFGQGAVREAPTVQGFVYLHVVRVALLSGSVVIALTAGAAFAQFAPPSTTAGSPPPEIAPPSAAATATATTESTALVANVPLGEGEQKPIPVAFLQGTSALPGRGRCLAGQSHDHICLLYQRRTGELHHKTRWFGWQGGWSAGQAGRGDGRLAATRQSDSTRTCEGQEHGE